MGGQLFCVGEVEPGMAGRAQVLNFKYLLWLGRYVTTKLRYLVLF